MRLVVAHAKAETVNLARYLGYSIPTIAFPAVLLLLFGRHFEEGEPDRLYAGFAAMALLGVAFFQFGVGIATSRTTPWETYLRTLPAGPGTRLAGRVLSALAFAVATVCAVSLVAFTMYGVRLPPGRALALASALLAGCIPFALLGIAFGYWLSPRAALPVANLLYLPLAIGGFLWTRPTEAVPHGVDISSQLLPTRNWMEVLDAVATGDHAVPLLHVAALATWGLVFFALAWWGYRRDEGERFT
jgi:ABC-2 type transport system permease protein